MIKQIATVVLILLILLTGTAHAIDTDEVITVSQQILQMDKEISVLSKIVYREARGCSTTQQAAVVWCVLNRVDSEDYPNDIIKVATQPSQFAWRYDTPVTEEIKALAIDVLTRWLLEKQGVEDVGRVLPKEYIFFAGRGGKNWFRDTFKNGHYWTWEWENPYAD